MRRGPDLADLLSVATERHPDHILVEDGELSFTYRDVAEHAARWAGALVEIGCRDDSRVLVHAHLSADFLIAVRAIIEVGAAVVPVDASYPAARKSLLLNESGADIVLELAPDKPLSEGGPRVVDSVSLNEGVPWARRGPGPALRLAWICGTSGSTGRPKAVALTDIGLVGLVEGIVERAGITENDRVLPMASIGFSVAAEELLSAWCAGSTIVILDGAVRHDPATVVAALAELRISVVQMVPAYWYEVVSACTRDDGRLRLPASLRLMILGSDNVAPAPVREWLSAGGTIGHEYGVSEGAVSQTFAVLDEAGLAAVADDSAGTIPIGAPLRYATVALLDRNGLPVAEGEVGEMYVGGPGVALGYLGASAATAATFLPDPDSPVPGSRRYRTGDLARRTSSGMLVFLGRVDHQLNVHGVRIEPSEVETVILGSPDVDATAVGVRDTGPGGTDPAQQLAALILWSENVRDSPLRLMEATRRLRVALADALPSTHLPSLLIAITAIPRNAHGKVDRGAVRALFAEPLRSAGSPPQDDLERRIHDVWCETLGAGEIGVDRPLEEIGVDSLGRMRLIAALDRVGLRAGRATLSAAATISSLASLLRTQDTVSLEGSSLSEGPLTAAQAELYIALGRQGRFSVAAEGYALPAPGADAAIMRDAIGDVMRAHPGLRTRLERGASGIRQRHDEEVPPLGGVVALPDAVALHDELRRTVARGFEPAVENLARWALWRTTDTGLLHVILVAHHLVVDGGSLRILAEDLAESYVARRGGKTWSGVPGASPAALATRESPVAHAVESTQGDFADDVREVVDSLPSWVTARPDRRPVERVMTRIGASERSFRRRMAEDHKVSESSLSLALLADALTHESGIAGGLLVNELVDTRDPTNGSWRTVGYLVGRRLIWLRAAECTLSAESMRQVHERRAADRTAEEVGLTTPRHRNAANSVLFGWGNLPTSVALTEPVSLVTSPIDVALSTLHVEMDPVNDDLEICVTMAAHAADHVDAAALLDLLASPIGSRDIDTGHSRRRRV